MTLWRLTLALPLLASACGARPEAPDLLLDRVRSRPVPPAVQARFSGQLESVPLQTGGTGTGGLRVALPDSLHVEVYDAFGASRGRVDVGEGQATLALPGRDAVVSGPEAELVLRGVTGGEAGLADVVGLFVGDLPLDHAPLVATGAPSGGRVDVVLDAGGSVKVEATLLVEKAVPTRIVARDRQGSLLAVAAYEGWHDVDGVLLPRRVGLSFPLLDIDAVLRVHAWEVLP